MPPLASWIAFAIAATALILIPGPSVLFVIGRSLSLGRRGGLISVLGNSLGMLPAITLVSLGVGALVAGSVVVFTVIKIAGALYLVYLGIQTIRHRGEGITTDGPAAAPKSTGRLLTEAAFVGVSNPKTIVFLVAVLPQFVDYRAGAVPVQLAVLGLTFFVIGLACDSLWALAAGTLRGWFGRSPRRLRGLRATGGVMMIGLGGVLAAAGHGGK